MMRFGHFCAVAVMASMPVAAQQDFSKVEIRSEKAGGNVYVLYGAGGNIGVSVGEDGVFLIDDQFAPLSDKIRAEVATLSDKPIRYVINTHYHFDHTGGNENFGKTGSVIVAHDNIRVRMKAGSFIKAFNAKVDPAPDGALPVVTFNDEMSLHLNGDEARIIHVENAHTDGDSIIHFKAANVIHMGDTVFNRLPFIDVDAGGSIDGVISALSQALSIGDDETVFIPGHGPKTLNKSELTGYRDMLVNVRARLQALVDEGKSLEEIVAARPLDDLGDWLGAGPGWTDTFIGLVYQNLT